MTVYFCTDNNELKTTNTFFFQDKCYFSAKFANHAKYIDLITNDFFFQDD